MDVNEVVTNQKMTRTLDEGIQVKPGDLATYSERSDGMICLWGDPRLSFARDSTSTKLVSARRPCFIISINRSRYMETSALVLVSGAVGWQLACTFKRVG